MTDDHQEGPLDTEEVEVAAVVLLNVVDHLDPRVKLRLLATELTSMILN